MTYNPLCYDLAEAALEDEWFNSEQHRAKLAALIQSTIESYIDNNRPDYEPSDPPGWEGGFAENH